MILLPEVKLNHLANLTDDTGLLQHSKFSTALKREGYTTDDNSRALIACLLYDKLYGGTEVKKLVDTYLSFLLYMQNKNGKMHNFLAYNREFLDDATNEECMGRTIWACGNCLNSDLSKKKKSIAKEIIDKIFPWTTFFNSPRAIALTIMGLSKYQKAYAKDKNLASRILELSTKLLDLFNLQKTNDWIWFEPYLTYANGHLSQSLFLAYDSNSKYAFLEIAKTTLDFLIKVQFMDGIFVPIGNNGWYVREKTRAIYDQQPIETATMVEATLTAFKITQDRKYLETAYNIFEWFLGKNLKSLAVYDRQSYGCYDGLTAKGLNLNQGAESIVTYLTARLNLELISHEVF